ncbi:PIG-L family deacetylase [Chloroflexi bacterium TSY]|nr:PIG-L family deacetylase [Chloroflexi bacterium TSY]
MNRSHTLLGIFAHPDDESFGPGGTLARYAAKGINVHVLIATDGIAGSVEDERYTEGQQTLAQVRATELSNAAVALGITSIWSLPYRDSGMRGSPDNTHSEALIQQPIKSLTAQLVDYMVRLQPDVVLTHDPFGGYGHPDHIRCCEATTLAFHRLCEQDPSYRPQKLYYTVFDKRILKLMVRIMPFMGQNPRAVGRNKDIDLVEISRWETPVHAVVDVANYLDRKDAASRAHASQFSGGPGFLRFLPTFLRQHFLRKESFTRAYPAPDGHVENDLFSGIE